MNDWRRFFDEFAPRYDEQVFTQNTDAEIDFLVEHLRVPTGARILDVGCGTGRHSVALVQRGYRVTGVDLSAEMLRLARQHADAASVTVEWVHASADQFVRPAAFDAAICLCEGAMCLLAAGDDPLQHDQTILANVASSLLPGSRFVLNVLNACRQIRRYQDTDIASGRFDVVTLTEVSDAVGLLGEEGASMQVCERGYTPPEIHRMLVWAGFQVVGVYGGTAGDWGLRPPKLDEIELMAIAEAVGPAR